METSCVLGAMLVFSFYYENVLGIVNVKSSTNFTHLNTSHRVHHTAGLQFEDVHSNVLSLNQKLGFDNVSKDDSRCKNVIQSINAEVVCVNDKKCQETCKAGYQKSTGETVTNYVCKKSEWVNEKTHIAVVDKCEPKCEPACKNGGQCISPNTCQCSFNFSGPICETVKVRCPSQAPTPLFSRKKCTAEHCTATCIYGYVFADGSTLLELFCTNGKWVSSKIHGNSSRVPDCLPVTDKNFIYSSALAVCNPPCLNGGKCIVDNVCFCPEEFRGNVCQYPVSVCDASKLHFNGNYNCTGNEEQFSCQLSCPSNTNPEEKFEEKYVCLYSEGKFMPANIPQCRIGQVIDGVKFFEYESKLKIVSRSPTTCMMWNARHLKTLNNHVLNFKSNCLYTLIQDEKEHLFHIQVDIKKYIIQKIIIYINNVKYILNKTADGKPNLLSEVSDKPLLIPCQLTDLRVEIASGKLIAVYLPAVNLYLVWDLENEIQLDLSSEFWDRTNGLCGRGSSPLQNIIDLEQYLRSAAVSSLLEKCEKRIEESAQCEENDLIIAEQLCSKLKTDFTFQPCRQKMPVEEYVKSCEWSYCNCEKGNRLECVCEVFAKFIQHYNQLADAVKIDWRDLYNCTFLCPINQTYTSCMPVSQATCNSGEMLPSALQKYCEEGCICAAGTVLHDNKCIKKEECPCMYNGHFHESESVIPKDCNKCTCIGGKWSCTEAVCRAECLLIGEVHYRTFDGKRFDLTGSCSYKLLVSENVTIEMDQSVGVTHINSKIPRSLKSIIIYVGKRKIILEDSLRVVVDNEEIENLPIVLDDKTYIRRASTSFMEVVLDNGLNVHWSGKDRLKIFANASLLGKTKGLCGTFNYNQEDDLLTPEGDVEKSIIAFINKWKSDEKCETLKTFERSEACEIFIQNKPIAESYCKNLTSDVFKVCQSHLNPSEYYEDCLTDICACEEASIADCFCPIVNAYAEDCAHRGTIIDWRNSIRSCGIHCPTGQIFEYCGPSCQRSCSDIANGELCYGNCVEGCYCPTGFTFNEHEICIPISECYCQDKDQKRPAGYIGIRNETGILKACECKNAMWECREATKDELEKYERKTSCTSPNMEYVECEPPIPVTCRNMHNPPHFSSKKCMAGCICKEGYVLESVSKKCVKPTECPCHHSGRSYSDGEMMRQDCNNCTCYRGRWDCTKKECPTTCSSWGDSHFRTFDGRFFDFQGTCDYVFAKGKLSSSKTFSVSIEIVPCGTGGTSCTKSVTVNVGSKNASEGVTLNKDDDGYLKKSFKKFDIISSGMYVTVILKGMSVFLFWDKGTRVSLQVHPNWKNKLSGLCGNNNGNALDDFQTPSGGLIEVLPSVFADSWKLQQYCPFPSQIEDPCVLHPYRKFWSIMKCSHLKDNPFFQQCHSQVPVEDYYKRCVFDSCACDQGGDCECLCTVFSAYAQECNAKGVSMKWRRQDICPIQCETDSEYSPCISPCPVLTCNNLGIIDSVLDQCEQLPCIEGCKKKTCPAGQVLRNSSSQECVSPSSCECMDIDGHVFQENEKIFEDKCHSCYCSKGKKVCTGVPCKPTTTPLLNMSRVPVTRMITTMSATGISTSTPIPEENCTYGWTEWLLVPKNYKITLGRNRTIAMKNLKCPPQGMKALQCQIKSRGLIFVSDWKDIVCDFEKPILCNGRCVDLRIRIDCDCELLPPGPVIQLPPVIIPVKIECKIKCNQLCHHYRRQSQVQELCISSQACFVSHTNISCPEGMYWRDEETCVTKDACTCSAHDGSLIKPALFHEEDDCSICQCINNEYVCTSAMCPPTEVMASVTEPFVTEPSEFTVPPAFVTPLPPCNFENLVPIDEGAFYNASSSSEDNLPTWAKLITFSGEFSQAALASVIADKNVKNTNSWRAATTKNDQYLDIDLGRIQPVYGIVTAGNPIVDEYVKSFRVLYSTDGEVYSYATSGDGSTHLFRGTYDHRIPETQLFSSAVEARFIRIKPASWHKWISMLVRVLGCAWTTKSPQIINEVCGEPMGFDSGKMHPTQITVSSKMKNFTPKDASLSSSSGWVPFLASSNQWIQFDFMGERIIDGIKTKGSTTIAQTESWIEAYKIKYSSDGVNWNPVIDDTKAEQIFSGNYDAYHVYSNVFHPPIRTRYLRLYPVKWSQFPSLRLEILGCSEPYPTAYITNDTTSYTEYETTTLSYSCNICNGILFTNCSCAEGTLWNGDTCVKEEMCPCIDGLLTYPVGSVFIKTDCEKCVCSLGGNIICQPTVDDCAQCNEENKLRVVNDDCSCECKSCPANTRLCRTSNICLNEDRWCNGYKECPDDETDCEVITTGTPAQPQANVSSTIHRNMCPVPACPDGYSVVYSQLSLKTKPRSINALLVQAKDSIKRLSFNETARLLSSIGELFMVDLWFSGSAQSENVTKYIQRQNSQSTTNGANITCKDWTCVAKDVDCAKPRCPLGTKLTTMWTGETCPTYECLAPLSTEKECSVNGRLISTFDGLAYQYDICDHVLAQDKIYNTWKVTKISKCPFVGPCVVSLVIHHQSDVIELFTNFTARYNGYIYTVHQLQTIGNRGRQFIIQPASNNFVIFGSANLKFNVVWSSTGTVKLIIESSLLGMVNGLCGLFDFNKDNDKSKPDGTVTSNTQEFGDSWKAGNELCKARMCPKNVLTKARDICDSFKLDPFNVCDYTMNINHQISKCYESVCTCASTSLDFDVDCRCSVLHNFAIKCLNSQPGVDISSWRLKFDCPANCTVPLVYQECYDRQCEPSCESPQEQCPRTQNRCFPGCYCPEGLVRKANTCVKPAECRDCICSSNGISQLITFDQLAIPLDNNCASTILLQTKKTEALGKELKIILTSAPCVNPYLKGICPHGLTIFIDNTEILMAQSEHKLNALKVVVVNTTVQQFPYTDGFIKISESPGLSAKLSVPSLQLDITFMSRNKGFSVQLPSHLYSNKLQGICGTCNKDQTDDLVTPSGETAENYVNFIKSWRTNYTADTDTRNCSTVQVEMTMTQFFNISCAAPPSDNDPCVLLLNKEIFGMCHAIVKPEKFVDLCYNLTCHGISYCSVLEAYALECQKNEICVRWRDSNICPYNCPQGFVYDACSIGCEINCDNYQSLREHPSLCTEPFSEGCICPIGKVISNGSCIDEFRCHPCDRNNHYYGDRWFLDNCTTCECSKDNGISCHKKDCSADIICPVGMKAEIDPNNDDPCCLKHTCVFEKTKVNCSEPAKIECGKNQVVKLDVTAENCTHYICVCIPREECPITNLNDTVELLPGMRYQEKKEGCCPSVELFCDKNLCTLPPECPQYHILKDVTPSRSCCPVFKCDLPPRTCFHEYRWITANNGSERLRMTSEVYVELKQVGDSWFDGPCRFCMCTNESSYGICNPIKCGEPEYRENYILKPFYQYGECCPVYKVVACKMGGVVHEVNSSWIVENEPCKTIQCVQMSMTGEISLKEIVKTCQIDCERGWKYMEPEDEITQCCGSCKQEACVDSVGLLHLPNTTWLSDDECVKFTCDDQFNIVGYSETCPNVSDCPEQLIYEDACCKKCNISSSAQTDCNSISVPLKDTINLISIYDAIHGNCTNSEIIKDFSRCDGSCFSFSFFDKHSLQYSNFCKCCIGSRFKSRNVPLSCTSGYTLNQTVQIPSECHCQSCSSIDL